MMILFMRWAFHSFLSKKEGKLLHGMKILNNNKFKKEGKKKKLILDARV